MRKVFLSLVAVLLCGVTFAQTPITKTNFVSALSAAESGDSFILMEDINLGELETSDASIIPSFSGTFDGNNYTIYYQASFYKETEGGLDALGENSNHSLFGSVSGTIKNLNVNANVTLGGTANNMNVALICGSLTSSGVIENCNVSGSVNSTVNPTIGGGSDAGLIVGESAGTVKYCTGSGNVAGVGYVGGLIGQMTGSASVLGCSFKGSVNAVSPTGTTGGTRGSFAGGICGYASNNSTFNFCLADAFVDGVKVSSGISSTTVKYNSPIGIGSTNTGTPDVTNSYAAGEVSGGNDNTITNSITNSAGTQTNNHYEGEVGMSAQDIVNALNGANSDPHFYFDVTNGEVVLVIGQRVCNVPTNLQVNITGSTATITWDAPADATRFEVSVTSTGETNTTPADVTTRQYQVDNITQGTNYEVSVRTKCGNNFYSDALVSAFDVDCIVNGLIDDIKHNSAVANWSPADGITYTYTLAGGNGTIEEVSAGELNLTGLDEATNYTLTISASCDYSSALNFTTKRLNFETAATGDFNLPSTWKYGAVPQGEYANIKINQGHTVTVYHDLKITDKYKITENNGALRISQRGQLINKTSTNVPGIVEIESVTKNMNKWSLVGAPFAGYQLKAVMPYPNSDVAMVQFNHTTGNWSTDWATINSTIGKGEGVFAWPFIDATMSFTTYGDMDLNQGYDFDRTDRAHGNSDYTLNNDNFTVGENITTSSWMALANPYPAKLSVSKFLGDNTGLQGTTIYGWNGDWFDIATQGDIAMTEGFFVNVSELEDKIVTFKKSQMTDYPNNPSTGSKVASRELIELTLQNGKDKVRVYFAHNEEAEQGYDIFDANKMFATTGVAEPYFVTDGIALIKEEVAELPYYATMNVRSQEDTVMNFVLTNLPEGYAVSIIDGEEVIDMIEGGVYSTEIFSGENADRFKVLVKKNVGLADVKELDVTITNNNRQVNITADESVRTEVYNILGQKVFESNDTTFVLSDVASGAYVVKVFGASASKTQKIVVE